MRKFSVIMLFLLPLVAFSILAIAGVIVNDDRVEIIESAVISGEDVKTSEQGYKYIILYGSEETSVITFSYLPETAKDFNVDWKIIQEDEYIALNPVFSQSKMYMQISVKKVGGTAYILLYNSVNDELDSVRVFIEDNR